MERTDWMKHYILFPWIRESRLLNKLPSTSGRPWSWISGPLQPTWESQTPWWPPQMDGPDHGSMGPHVLLSNSLKAWNIKQNQTLVSGEEAEALPAFSLFFSRVLYLLVSLSLSLSEIKARVFRLPLHFSNKTQKPIIDLKVLFLIFHCLAILSLVLFSFSANTSSSINIPFSFPCFVGALLFFRIIASWVHLQMSFPLSLTHQDAIFIALRKKDAIFIGLGSFFFFGFLFIRCVYYVRFSNGCLSVSFANSWLLMN